MGEEGIKQWHLVGHHEGHYVKGRVMKKETKRIAKSKEKHGVKERRSKRMTVERAAVPPVERWRQSSGERSMKETEKRTNEQRSPCGEQSTPEK